MIDDIKSIINNRIDEKQLPTHNVITPPLYFQQWQTIAQWKGKISMNLLLSIL